MASTETVTILFTDIVGSTSLSQRVGPEAADELRQGHFSLLRQALSATEGSEVKNLGDGIMAVFTSTSASVACAVAMQQAVEQDNRHSPNPMGLRVAVSVGDVTIEEDDYFGDPVVEAARLCSICEGGQILVPDIVRVLGGRRNPQVFNSLGDHTLKGIVEPVHVYEVAWEPAAVSAGIPLPDRLVAKNTASIFGFFGRDQEREQLSVAIKGAMEGNRQVAFLSGEPGIGKTSLSRQIAESAHALGVSVLYGRCDEDLGVSYQPFVEAINHLVVHANEELLSRHVDDYGGTLSGLVPALSKRIPEMPKSQSADPDSERLQLFSAVEGLLEGASADQALLLVLDDLHWADKASLQLLRHLANSSQLQRIMILGTYRDSELTVGHPLSDALAFMHRLPDVVRIDLAGLDDLEVIQMMEKVAGHEMDDSGVGLAHAVRRESDGNPFFTTEILLHLGEAGLVHQDDRGHWVASEDLYENGLPQSVREVVGQRVGRLGEETRRVLSIGAVVGRDFDIGLLAAVAEMDEDPLLDLIDLATEAGLVNEAEGMIDRFSFTHALTQHTLYEDLGATRRARVHRRIAEALEQLCGDAPEARAGEIARHFVAATRTADAARALTYTAMAGKQALAQLAPADALGWLTQALDLYRQVPADEVLHCDLLIDLGHAQRQTGNPDYRETLFQAAAIAKGLGDSGRLATAAIANSRGGVSAAGLVDEERVAVYEEALDALGDEDSIDRAVLLATLFAELDFSGDRLRLSTLSSEALAMARRLGDPLTFLRVASRVYNNSSSRDDLQDRLTNLTEAASIALTFRDPVEVVSTNWALAVACVHAGDRDGFETHLLRCQENSDRFHRPYENWKTAVLTGLGSSLAGDTEAAEGYANAALAIGAEGVPEAMTVYGVQLIEIRRMQGRLDELADFADLMAQALVENPGLPGLRAVLARMYCDLDRKEEARPIIQGDVADGFSQLPDDETWLPTMCVMSHVCLELEDRTAARHLQEILLPWRDQIVSVGVSLEGQVAHWLGGLAALLGDYEQAETHFAKALQVAERLRTPYWSALTQLTWATMQQRRDREVDRTTTVNLAGAARDLGRQYGFADIVTEAEALISH